MLKPPENRSHNYLHDLHISIWLIPQMSENWKDKLLPSKIPIKQGIFIEVATDSQIDAGSGTSWRWTYVHRAYVLNRQSLVKTKQTWRWKVADIFLIHIIYMFIIYITLKFQWILIEQKMANIFVILYTHLNNLFQNMFTKFGQILLKTHDLVQFFHWLLFF